MRPPDDPLRVVCMLWRRPGVSEERAKKWYRTKQVGALRQMLVRRSAGPVHLTCVTNLPEVGADADTVLPLPEEVAALPSQYPKLWLHSRAFAQAAGPEPIIFTDLDVVVLGDWGQLLEGGTPRFRGNYLDPSDAPAARMSRSAYLTGRVRPDPGRRTPPVSTSLFTFRPGELSDLWDRFNLRRARSIRGWTGTDQKWVNWVLGPDVPQWAPGPRFGLIADLLAVGAPPPPEMLLVTCTHRMVPWDPDIRARLPWLAEAYPLA